MTAKAIREATGKDLINRLLDGDTAAIRCKFASVNPDTKFSNLIENNSWLETEKLVVKPDQLIKRRGKLGLIAVNKNLEEVKQWISEHMNKDQKIGAATGKLRSFIIEPFIPHKPIEEMYVCIYSHRHADTILFYHEGGVDIGDVDSKALKLDVPVGETLDESRIDNELLGKVPSSKKPMINKFISRLYKLYVELYFTYLEINPLVVTDKEIYILDLAAKLDSTAEFLCKPQWGEVEYPPPFGRDAFAEEAYIADLDAKSGASLKLTILNKSGRIWTMVAGGGASVIYSDTICDYGGASELANYGEYSGAPSEQQTYEYAKTILSLMVQEKHPEGKVLIIGGGIANFTNVASTFRGIITALREFQQRLIDNKISIFVRRAGPNYQEGLRRMREVGQTLGIPLYVFGPETHMTTICGMALGKKPIPKENAVSHETTTANFVLPSQSGSANNATNETVGDSEQSLICTRHPAGDGNSKLPMFAFTTKAIVWGMQTRAVQSMLDFDFVCRRTEPSVVGIIYPFTGDHKQKYYWGHKEILIPVYKKMNDAMTKHPDADVLVNFASLRSAYQSTVETMDYAQIRTIAIIAEGIPENMTRKLIKLANEKKVSIIGPATVGGLKPGCFKIGNTGGMMDNVLHSKLYRPGSVAYVSRSGGMSNELNNIISKATDGVYEGVAIGGDRYPGTTFMDHIMRYQQDDKVKMIVLLGEVGGTEEYEVCQAIQKKIITKPLIAWCIGTCASMFTSEVQFGHAGSCANSAQETAAAKNEALKLAGAFVPDSFDTLGDVTQNVYNNLLKQGIIVPAPEVPPPTVPMDYSWARELGLIRKPASFMTSICDERGQELLYAGMPISDVLNKNVGIGGVISLLWFQRCLPPYVCKFFEMCLMVTADHGPAVSGAHNTIVCARAGKDLVSSVVSGLLTIGDRFGGALDGAHIFYRKSQGVVLILDGIIQCSQHDEFSYQEMISFLPLCAHANPKKVLIIGGGDGGVAREVSKHPLVQEIVQVEIDQLVIDVSKRYLPFMAKGFYSPKLTLIVDDGFEYMRNHQGEFDVIITDSSDPIGPAVNLFTESYFVLLKKALKSNGIICSQAGTVWVGIDHTKKTMEHCRRHFDVVCYALTSVPTYPTGQIGFIVASLDGSNKLKEPKAVFEKETLEEMKLRYYNDEVHRAAYVLPLFVQKVLQ